MEWFRASARKQRAVEAVRLLEAEMERVQRFFVAYRGDWINRSKVEGYAQTTKGRAAFSARCVLLSTRRY